MRGPDLTSPALQVIVVAHCGGVCCGIGEVSCYASTMMNENDTTFTLDAAVRAARSLPAAAQEALAHEIMQQIEDLSPPERPAEHQSIVSDRLSRPLAAVSRDDLMAMLRRYNPDL